MLEDQSIQHLISWSSSNESFVMSPSSEFSKVLAYGAPSFILDKSLTLEKPIFQTYEYLLICEAAQHVRISQR